MLAESFLGLLLTDLPYLLLIQSLLSQLSMMLIFYLADCFDYAEWNSLIVFDYSENSRSNEASINLFQKSIMEFRFKLYLPYICWIPEVCRGTDCSFLGLWKVVGSNVAS